MAVEPRARDLLSDFEVRDLLDQLPAILYVADVGAAGRWHYVSSGVKAILGFSPEEWLADPGLWERQLDPEDRDRVIGREGELLAPEVPDEYRMRHRSGETVWVRDEAALVTDAEGRARWHGVISDITDRKVAEAELERRAEQQAAVARLGERALESAELADLIDAALEDATRILEVDMGAVLEQNGVSGSLSMRASRGLARGELSAAQLSHGLTAPIEGRTGRWGVVWLGGAPERFRSADADFVQALANVLADAIQQRASEDDIRHQALHDPLTDLPNRVLFLSRLERALAWPGAQVAVMLLDIDNFKLVNDSLGHGAGDELLTAVAPRLARALRPGDTIARLGGDEFVLLLEQIPDVHAAAQVAARIMTEFESPFALGAAEHFATVSLGIALADGAGALPSSLVRDADAAMYQAKERGRARFEVFDGAMRTRSVERLSIENDLRRAIERHELHLVYQPIVSLRDESIVAVEALLRWQHPERGLISPADFIPVAEESGLIEPIGRWVLDTACAQGALWHEAFPDSRPIRISVNVSVRQFTQRALAATVARTIEQTGITPSSLCLEITESVLLREPEGVSETIKELADLGVRFALDDFGTGYSSLAYLTRLPIDALKVDRSFVQTLGNDERSAAITTAIVRMAQALSIEIIAEGVETQAQLSLMRSLGCPLAQGFYFHRPMDAQSIEALLDLRRVAHGV